MFDGLDENSVWTGSRQFEKTQKDLVEALGGEEFVMAKEIVSDNYARYIVYVQPKEKEPETEQPKLKGKEVVKTETKKKIPKGGKPLPKIKDKKRKLSMKKGKRLPQKKRFKAILGGRK